MVLEQFIIDADIIWDQVGKTFFENPEAKPGRIMRVQVVNAGIIEDLTGYTLNLGWTSVRDPSKFGLDAFDEIDITKGIFEIEYTSGMLTNIGPLNASLQLVPPGQGRPIESNNFKLTVKNSAINPEAIQGETSFSTLENALVEVNGWNARIDVVEQEFKDRADALDGAYPVRLTAAEQLSSQAATKADTASLKADAMASGSPKGVYSTLSALQTAYPTGTTGAYLITADGKWYYWSGSAWTVGGVYQATSIADNSVTYAKRTKVGMMASFVPCISAAQIAVYNPNTGIFDFKSMAGGEPTLIYGSERYVIPVGTTVDLKTSVSPSSTFQWFFNTVTKVFRVVNSSVSANEDEILVATGRNSTGLMNIGLPYTINGKAPVAPNSLATEALQDGAATYTKRSKIGIVATIMPSTNSANAPDYNTTTKILDFKSVLNEEPSLVYGKEVYAIPAGTTISLAVDGTSTFKLFFNTLTKVFRSVSVGTIPTEDEILVATGRSTNGSIWIGCAYTVNGLRPSTPKSLSYDSRTRAGVAPFFMPSTASGFPNYTPATGILDFNSKFSNQEPAIIWGKESYSIPVGTTLDLKTPVSGSSTFKILFNTDDKTFRVVVWSTAVNENEIVIGAGRNTTGYMSFLSPYTVNGLFLDNTSNGPLFEYEIVFNTLPTFSATGSSVTVSGLTAMYLLVTSGVEIKAITVTGLSWTLTNNQVLVWNVDDNAIVAQGNNVARNTRNVVLLSYHNGRVEHGYLKDWYRKWEIEQLINPDSIPSTFMGKTKTMSTTAVSNQGLTVVGQEVWGFFPSTDNNSTYANIYRWDVDTFTKKTNNFTHNLGHCASADYNPETDVLMTANGTSPTDVLPRLDLTVNVSALCGDAAQIITYGGSNVVSINFFTKDGSDNVIKQIGGSGLIACWGEEKSIVYLLTGQNEPRKIFRCKLGMGSNDFSDATGTDVTKWGNFVAGKGANEYNGTAKILSTYTGVETTVYQGVCFHDGFIYLCAGGDIPRVLKIQCNSNGRYDILSSYELEEYDSSGVRIAHEPEGVCVYKGVYLLMGVMGTNARMLIFPLYNKQLGKGTIGTRVVLDFPCVSAPNVVITPTSPTTDLYVSQVDRLGFTVSSTSGGSGTFNWECPIS